MKKKDILLAITVAITWGVQFVIVGKALTHFPPLFFAAIRFSLVAIPAVFFIKKPKVSILLIAAVGITLSAAQFGFQYIALSEGMPAGLLSLVLQSQAVFTLVIGIVFLKEKPGMQRLTGLFVATAGIVIIAFGYGDHARTSMLPFILVLMAGLSWGIGNVLTRLCGNSAGFSLIIWSSLFAPIPLLLLSILTEGPHRIIASFYSLDRSVVYALVYTVFIASLFGYGVWSLLLSKYESFIVAPFSLLVPPIGLLTAWIVQGEVSSYIEVAGGILMLMGALMCVTKFRR